MNKNRLLQQREIIKHNAAISMLLRKDVEESITICPTRHCEEIKETSIYVRYLPIDEAI
ncbi:MAG TPA: hypothetical protein VG847_05460 [Chitinophagaceae bacterium]|nr:hypothetical protein [Chitinophagaceae bacterium]